MNKYLQLQPKGHQSGMGLVEIMVALVIGLVASLVIFQTLRDAGHRAAVTTTGGDVQTSGALGMYYLERDARLAGWGFAAQDSETGAIDAVNCNTGTLNMLWIGFDVANPGMQFVELSPWIPSFNINYHLGVDGISMLFVVLNAFITIIVVAAGWEVIQSKVAQYMAAFLIMSGLMNGIFTALDGILFYVFFEASLIPLYLIIGVWGGPNRVYAAIKFFLYTLFGSLLFLVAQMYLFLHSGGSFSILDWQKLPIEMGPQLWIFAAFLIAFAVKVPTVRPSKRQSGDGIQDTVRRACRSGYAHITQIPDSARDGVGSRQAY